MTPKCFYIFWVSGGNFSLKFTCSKYLSYFEPDFETENSQPGSENKRQKETLLTLEIRRGCETTEDGNCPHRGPCLQIISKHARYRVILPANYSERFRYSTTDLNAFVSLRTNGEGVILKNCMVKSVRSC